MKMNAVKSDTKICSFRDVSFEDRARIEAAVPQDPLLSCEYCFANLFSWRNIYETRWGLYKGSLTAHFKEEDEILMPAGLEPEPAELMDLFTQVFPDGEGTIGLVPSSYIRKHPSVQDFFSVEESMEQAEYVHETENLFNLKGSKFHSKRNLLSQFQRNNPGSETRKLSREHIQECFSLAEKWCSEKTCRTLGITHEQSAIREALDNYEQLGLDGVLISCGGRIVAFSAFSIFNGTCIVHFEKADRAVKGAAQAVNFETAKAVFGRCRYINREQDVGDEGLRKAKSSYCPDIFEPVFNLTAKKPSP